MGPRNPILKAPILNLNTHACRSYWQVFSFWQAAVLTAPVVSRRMLQQLVGAH